MKKFGSKILIFGGLPGISFILIILVFYNFTRSKLPLEAKNISEYECLLMGDSQIQRINSSFLTLRTKNLASEGEHFYFTYNKLQKILKNKDFKVKKIILGASIHSFGPNKNRAFDIKLKEGKSSLMRYLYFIPSFYEKEFINFKNIPLYSLIKGVFHEAYWGGMYESNNSNPSTKTINRIFDYHFSIKKDENKYSQSQKKYLNKIDSLCNLNDLDLIICSLPYHTEYTKKINPDYIEFFYKTIGGLKSRYRINFLSDVPKSDWMADANHLNKEGAAIYSKKINEILESQMSKMVDKK